MKTKKKICLLLTIIMVACLFPLNTGAASSGSSNLEFPELPPLNIPELQMNYGDMLKELEENGFGKYKFGKDSVLPLPEVESPVTDGKSVVDKFKEEFGDKWKEGYANLESMKSDSIIPSNLQDFVKRFKDDSVDLLEAMKSNSEDAFNAKVKEITGQASILHDLQKMYDEFEWEGPSDILTEGFKWTRDDILNFRVPTHEEFRIMSQLRDVENIPFFASKIFETFNWKNMRDIKDKKKFLEESLKSAGDIFDRVTETQQEMNNYIEQMKGKISSGELLDSSDFEKGSDLANKESMIAADRMRREIK
jgi:hypothetical protein